MPGLSYACITYVKIRSRVAASLPSERYTLGTMNRAGMGARRPGRLFGRSHTTIRRELLRNACHATDGACRPSKGPGANQRPAPALMAGTGSLGERYRHGRRRRARLPPEALPRQRDGSNPVRPRRPDSNQTASKKVGAVHRTATERPHRTRNLLLQVGHQLKCRHEQIAPDTRPLQIDRAHAQISRRLFTSCARRR